jgi:hypothetical protein
MSAFSLKASPRQKMRAPSHQTREGMIFVAFGSRFKSGDDRFDPRLAFPFAIWT